MGGIESKEGRDEFEKEYNSFSDEKFRGNSDTERTDARAVYRAMRETDKWKTTIDLTKMMKMMTNDKKTRDFAEAAFKDSATFSQAELQTRAEAALRTAEAALRTAEAALEAAKKSGEA